MKLKLSTRLVITMVVIQAIVLIILFWNNLRTFEQTHIERQELSYISEQDHLSETVSIGLLYADRAMLAENLLHLKARRDFGYAVITDRKNRVMASSGKVPENFSHIQFNGSYKDALNIDLFHLSSKIYKEDSFLGTIYIGFSTNEVKQILYNARIQNIALSIIAIIFTLIASILLGRYISSNLRLLESGAKHFADGELDYRIRKVNDNTINDVANAFNLLAENLQQNIRELNKRNQLLFNSEEQVRLLLDSTAEAIYGVDMQGHCTFANPACVKMLGYENDSDLIGQNMHKLTHHTYSNGDIYPEDACPIYDVLKTGEGIHIDNEVLWRADNTSFPSEYWSYPIIRNETITGAVITFLNISERRLAEEGLHRSQKMNALGKLTGGIAHDYNNLLGVILGYSELLKVALKDNPKLEKYANEISHAGERGSKLVKKLLGFTRKKSSEAKMLILNTILQDEKNLLEKTLTVRIKLVLELDDNLHQVWLDSNELEDTILNLCINAMHSIEGNGQLTIKTYNEDIDDADAKLLGLVAGDHVVLSITDTGTGMNEITKEQIFDPFFTTKGDKGTGLGLSQVYGFVQRSNGAIKVTSELGNGSCFTLYFPRYYKSDNESQLPEENKDISIKGSETILLVDDEPALLDIATEILNIHGFNTITAESAKMALDILEDEMVDLIISDIIMPEMNGYELASIVQEKYPNIKIQLVSGYSDSSNSNLVDKSLQQNLLKKPYNSKDLLEKIRILLVKE